ncbi:MAG: helix-turn-helix domain-containing protein [Prevotella sp.]|jgi:transcriptional regulator with XRE-family HTH domain|nr:helix-turn-helix domain-containing protein [Prevotella sp.]
MKEKAKGKICTHHGENIGRFRRMHGWKQEDLAAKMGLSQTQVSKYELSEEIDDAMLAKFSEALGVPVQMLKECDHEETINKFITYINHIGDGGIVHQPQEQTINNPLEALFKMHDETVQLLKDQITDLKAEIELLRKGK